MFRKHFPYLIVVIVVLLCCEEQQPLPVKIALSAFAGDDQEIPLGDTVKILSVTNADSVSWNIVSKPVWSLASISDSLVQESFFIPDLPGEYVVKLEAAGNSQKIVDTLMIKVYMQAYVGQPIDLSAPFGKLVNVEAKFDRVLIAPEGDCERYSFHPNVTGDYQVSILVYTSAESREFILPVRVSENPIVVPNSMQLLLEENFDTIDNSWTSSFQPGNFRPDYHHLSPPNASVTPNLSPVEGIAVLFSGTGSTTMSKSLGDLNLDNYRYLEIVLAIKEFKRNQKVSVYPGSSYTEQFNSDFKITINNLNIFPRWFPYLFGPRPATCYPMLDLTNRTLVFSIDTQKKIMKVQDGNNEITANFDIISSTNLQDKITLVSHCGTYWDDLFGTYYYPRATSVDYIKISGSN